MEFTRWQWPVVPRKRYEAEHAQLRLALLVAVRGLALAKAQIAADDAEVLNAGVALVRKDSDPTLTFTPQSPAQQVMRGRRRRK